VFSNSFAGIAPASVPAYIAAQLLGGGLAVLAIRALYPDVTPAAAAEVTVPHREQQAIEPG
jgi:arsenate reductase